MKPTRKELEKKFGEIVIGNNLPSNDAIDLAIWAMAEMEKSRGAVIPVPPVKEWPEDAEGVTLVWDYNIKQVTESCITTIPRPVEAWRPPKDKLCAFGDHDSVKPNCFGYVVNIKDGYAHDNAGNAWDWCALIEQDSDIHGTREQFRQRGRFWESGK